MRLKEPLTLKPYFGKQVIERPRRGSRTALSAKARSYGRIVDYGDGPEYEGFTRLPVSRKQEGYNKKLGDKGFSDVLGPLQNYLRSSCGRPWDDVYSEIAYHFGRFTRREGLRHIIDAHMDVAVNTYRGVDGNVWICDKHGVHKVGGFYYDFYVEPETGILREAANYRKWRSIAREKEAAKQLEVVPIAEGREYRKIDGIKSTVLVSQCASIGGRRKVKPVYLQMEERWFRKPDVVGSTPTIGSCHGAWCQLAPSGASITVWRHV